MQIPSVRQLISHNPVFLENYEIVKRKEKNSRISKLYYQRTTTKAFQGSISGYKMVSKVAGHMLRT